MARSTVRGQWRATGGFIGDLTGNVTGNVTGDVTGNVTGVVTESLATVAAAGATQGGATAIATTVSVVSVTVTASTQGVKLPTAAAGKRVTVLAAPTVGVKVYPATGARLGAASTNTAVTIASNKANVFYGISATTWRYVKGA